MAYQGYLMKIGSTVSPSTEIPLKYIKYDTFKTTYETLDLDSFRDANGLLHRNALTRRPIKVEFETPIMYKRDMDKIMQLIRSNYVSSVEQSLYLQVYVQELDNYVTQLVYMPNITFKYAQNSPLGFICDTTRIAFIGY